MLIEYISNLFVQGRSWDFSNGGGGGHTGSNNIVMAFSPRNIVGCLLKKGLQRGRSRAPHDPPSYAPVVGGLNGVMAFTGIL